MRQLLVITDGCSNVGIDPVTAAAEARRKGVVVNVIGVVDKGDMGRHGREEAMSIADAGGGMCRVVEPAQLSATAQMMTQQTMQLTLQQVVNRELMQVMGKSAEDLPPVERSRVMQVVDKLEEELGLRIVVAVDTSASMKDKMPTVREAIRDLAFSLQARQGASEVAVIAFPGSGDEPVRVVQSFTSRLDMAALDGMWVARGGTPTGPAIERAMALFEEVPFHRTSEDDDLPRAWSDEAAAP
ncbi:MAG: VWA domain-containing protein [Alicyclobacillus sp.]|nr:VWA domain-containing protein [Alicyclobacillus sp.]